MFYLLLSFLSQSTFNYLCYAGTPEERGLLKWAAQSKGGVGGGEESSVLTDTYEFPFGMRRIRR